KNRTFFHFLFQPQSGRSPVFHRDFIVPTARMRNGDVSEYASQLGVTIRNPYTGQPFPNNLIPQSMINPVARNVLGLVPTPNTGTPDALVNNFNWTDYNDMDQKWWQFRGDHKISDKNTISVNYYQFDSTSNEQLEGNPFPNAGFSE